MLENHTDLFAFAWLDKRVRTFFWCLGGNWGTNIAIIALAIAVYSVRVTLPFGWKVYYAPMLKKELSNTFFPRESFQLLLGFWFLPLPPSGTASNICFFFSLLGHSLSITAIFWAFFPTVWQWNDLIVTYSHTKKKQQKPLNSKQHFGFLFSRGRAHYHAFKKILKYISQSGNGFSNPLRG